MRLLYIKEKLMQTLKRGIFLLLFQILFCTTVMFASEQFSKEEILELKTNAWALYNTAQGKRALELLEAIPVEYRSEEIYTIMANIYEDNGDTNKAVDLLNRALAINPKYYKIYYNFGNIYIKRKSWELAIENFKLSIRYEPKFPYSYYNLGYCYLMTHNYALAKKNFIKAISLKNDDKDFYQNLAYAYKMLGKEKEAKKVLETYNKLK